MHYKQSIIGLAITALIVVAGCQVTHQIVKSQGTAQGKHGEVQVETTFKDGHIVAIDVLKQKENKVLAGAVFRDVKQAIIDNNSVDVDGITGATVTSNALKEAVSKSIEAAGVTLAAVAAAKKRKL